MGDRQNSVPNGQILCLNYNTGAWESSTIKKETSLLYYGSSTRWYARGYLFPTAAAKTPKPAAGPRQTSSANQGGLWHSDGSGNLRGPSNMETLEVAPAVHPRSRQFSIWWQNSPTSCSVSAKISYKRLSFGLGHHLVVPGFMSNNVNEYSPVLRSLAGKWVSSLFVIGWTPSERNSQGKRSFLIFNGST